MVCEIGGFGKELVKKVSKDDLQRPAARPVSSKLACLFSERLGLAPMRKWDEALASFLDAERSAPIV
jgi:dTDP-4-dehydrorhamnose reductase